ncbi:hypothetical protein AA103196_2365 [Ameyamaea chiangmaiensis NBRC 103196]|uniref:Lipoprotein n=1 Tax=Ameyamaea chiangmaiensis TaxID=442969 RepID=A0A850P5F8_9PROT|nr:hypothetical protein [Ameyamaea chiangmaiensis]MBS4075378.1 hypothetical protein [Ameyamaea chiangmaiensis]NVN39867.1 hypothetical protein [Ameyamaea chiangmaiensis]GBQ69973.1 hypothetical protein AA103196_2365 [Ameyamaea chiangmaiensis NBRC 103196]
MRLTLLAVGSALTVAACSHPPPPRPVDERAALLNAQYGDPKASQSSRASDGKPHGEVSVGSGAGLGRGRGYGMGPMGTGALGMSGVGASGLRVEAEGMGY